MTNQPEPLTREQESWSLFLSGKLASPEAALLQAKWDKLDELETKRLTARNQSEYVHADAEYNAALMASGLLRIRDPRKRLSDAILLRSLLNP